MKRKVTLTQRNDDPVYIPIDLILDVTPAKPSGACVRVKGLEIFVKEDFIDTLEKIDAV